MGAQRVVVVGAGIVGAAIARALVMGGSEVSVTVLEKEPSPGLHQTSRNSGVVHAGLYYQPGSDKARLSREGVRRLREYCRARGLPYQEVGKVLVALDAGDEARLTRIHERAVANGVPGVRWLGAAELTEIEPHVHGRAGLHSPTTAIVDFGRIAAAFLQDACDHGAGVRTGFEVSTISAGSPTRVTATSGETVAADLLVIAAGLHTDRLAGLAGDSPFPRIVPFRGEFHELVPGARHLVRGLIYPVPDPRYPFLGVHLTKRVDGTVLLGPNAVLALSREGYLRRDLEAREVRELLAFKGFRTFARANAVTGAREMWGSLNRRAFIAAARRYVPEIKPSDVVRAPAGVRAQAMDADGSLVDDFRFSRVGNVFSVRNAPSPAATASLAIADLVLDQLGLDTS
ncbi:hydroxyglutarate oxidase [Intrasporangium chromatireducens Q5-1]|uniref:Hydroxyglutarate oxidase n=1 Tax=Intrasporangium chromatireducens Q5-1 TaxID=584657 RepID=W9GS16_9MICO|nr:L-2-hydroxyglutarate oxidase [Intrasporangium chromatireducens]EWT07857.1 hydroxyglutarate oxidase [Intrasporangium chromatireducens Q5-1]